MNNSYAEYRKLHLDLANWLIILIVVAQIIMFFVLKIMGSEISFSQYFQRHILVTSLINFISLGVAFRIHKSKKFDDNIKNMAYLVCTVAIAFGVVIGEHSFNSTFCVLIIPIFLATGFGASIYLNVVTILVLLCLMVVSFFSINSIDDSFKAATEIAAYMEFAIIIVLSRVIASVIKDYFFINATKLETHESNNQNLEDQLLRDRMTGLYNHASFYGFLENITRQNGSDMSDVTLAVIDIDNFKMVNDTYGHSKGDEVIIFLATVLKRRFSDIGYVCRYGGEEFAVIFVNRKGKEVKSLMEGALEEFRSHTYSWKEDPVTFSCGICEYKAGFMTDKQLFGIADKVLYRAKNNGKNQCLL